MTNETDKLNEILTCVQKIIEMLSGLELSSSSEEDRYTYGKGYAEVIDENSYYTPYSSVVNLHSAEYISEAAMSKYMRKILSERNYGN